MSTSTISKTVFLAVPRETAWQYLTRKDKLKEWFHPAAADLQEGEDYALIAEDKPGAEKLCWGQVLSMRPPVSMVWSFTVKPLAGAMTTVTWTLEEFDGGTRVILLHEGVEEAAGEAALALLFGLDPGWDQHFARLREATINLPDSVKTGGSSCE